MSHRQLRRAAEFLLSLPEAEAATLLRKLDRAQVEAVAAEMARIGSPSDTRGDQALAMFAGNYRAAAVENGVASAAERIVEEALGASAPEIWARVQRRLAHAPFAELERVDNLLLIAALRTEGLQTIALVLAQLPVRRAALVLQAIPASRHAPILRRIATLAPLDSAVCYVVEEALSRRIAELAKLPTAPLATHSDEAPAEILDLGVPATAPVARWPLPLAS